MSVYQQISNSAKKDKKLFALLIDPEKCKQKQLCKLLDSKIMPDYIFVGGSQLKESIYNTVESIKNITDIPIVMFPGNTEQFATNIDALLFLSLASGRNPKFLIEQQIKAAPLIINAKIESISTGYILIDGGKISSVEKFSGTIPYNTKDIELIKDTALACQLLGNKLIYLEAGSGAINPVPTNIINSTKRAINIPLIVGGGIKTPEQMINAYKAGADVVVIGNHIENNPNELPLFLEIKKQYNNSI